ncbi:hypothetical protein H8356DRAFT_1751001 [Neocallimastix lanati (nom. inval.)]|nr:hypothetical protein H8356DRAFT_1751001 [Neocallimastix sp. JGI-2020a]
MSGGNQFLFNEHTFIGAKSNALYSLIYLISSNTKISPLLNCFFIIIEEFQLGYILFNNENLFSIPKFLKIIYSYLVFDNIPFKFFRIIESILSIFNILIFSIIVYHVLFISSDKYKVNKLIKVRNNFLY